MIQSHTVKSYSIFTNKTNFENGLGHFFISSSSSHFFNATDFGQHLFKMTVSLIDPPKLRLFSRIIESESDSG